MTQTFTDDCFDGSHVAQTDLANMEQNFAALKSNFSGGPTAPTNAVQGQWWYDTTLKMLKQYNGTSWVDMFDTDNEVMADDTVDTDSIVNSAVTAAKLAATAVQTKVTNMCLLQVGSYTGNGVIVGTTQVITTTGIYPKYVKIWRLDNPVGVWAETWEKADVGWALNSLVSFASSGFLGDGNNATQGGFKYNDMITALASGSFTVKYATTWPGKGTPNANTITYYYVVFGIPA